MTDASAITAITAITGILYIVATPIGNREDISLRATHVLQNVDMILAEDTRHSGQLLQALGIKKPLMSLHAHNEADKSIDIIRKLMQGKTFALISDAGTPLISDPGFPLVSLAQQHHIPVVPIPGACALIAALSAAGIPCESFSFFGFLPAKSIARQEKLKSLQVIHHTLVFYESTHRIMDSINDIGEVFGEHCELVVAKELTKTFERFIRGTSMDICAWLTEDNAHCKGEFVVIIPPRTPKNDASEAHRQMLKILLEEVPLKQAVKIAAQISNGNKNELYKMALELSKG